MRHEELLQQGDGGVAATPALTPRWQSKGGVALAKTRVRAPGVVGDRHRRGTNGEGTRRSPLEVMV